MSIFVSIASYRDEELVKTVKSLLDNADRPDDLVVGVFSQDLRGKHPDLSFVPNIRYEKIHSKLARGAGYARKEVMKLYDGEDFFFQIDSHMRFAQGWDTKLIDMYNWCINDAGTNKIILSQFPAPYQVHTDGKDYYPIGDKDFWDEPAWTGVVNTYYGSWAGKRHVIHDKSKPHKSHTVLAGYIFSHGDFVYDIPYDDRITFMGEELCIAIRAYTRGYEIYAPNEMLVWHFYTRKDRPKVWSSPDDSSRTFRWRDLETESGRVQRRVLLGEEQGIFGIDSRDRHEEFQKMIGIDFSNFYTKELEEKINMGLLHEELDFMSTRRTGYCMKNLHELCKHKECECTCHEGENDGAG